MLFRNTKVLLSKKKVRLKEVNFDQMSVKQPLVVFFGLPSNTEVPKHLTDFTCFFYEKSERVLQILIEKRPGLIVTIGPEEKNFPELFHLPTFWKIRWMHRTSLDAVHAWDDIYYPWYHASLKAAIEKNPVNPLVSVFSTSYKSKDRILRPHRSLIAQTYKNWEWVIFDDTPAEEDPQNWQRLCALAKSDPRIRIFKSSGNSGLIGEVKKNAASLCRGQYLAEVDHDDDLHPSCLQWIVDAGKEHPEAGFFYTDWCEVYEEDLRCHTYAEFFGEGFGTGYAVKHLLPGTDKPRWLMTLSNPGFNSISWKGIVGVANHIRVWRTSVYHEIGGFNAALSVCDDYELLLRTFLMTKIVGIPRMGYIQYRNIGGSNFTFLRNDEIQKQTQKIYEFYQPDFKRYFEQRNLPFELEFPQAAQPFWEQDAEWHLPELSLTLKPRRGSITIIALAKGSCKGLEKIIRKCNEQDHKDWELFIIGGKCDALAPEMNRLLEICDERVRWWNIQRERPDFILQNYVLRRLLRTEHVTYLDRIMNWENHHLSEMVKRLEAYPVLFDSQFELAHRVFMLSRAGYRRSKTEEFVDRLMKAVPEKTKKTAETLKSS